jgi:hypothetical protein
MLKQIKILTTTEQVITIGPTGESTVISSKIVNTKIINNDNQVLNPVKFQFTNSEVKYGIIVLKKSNPLRSLYSPNDPVNVSVNGLTGHGKWHAKQARIDGLSTLFSQFRDLQARVFNLSFDALTNTLVFNEI